MTFLPNVSQFVNIQASPKQPQSATGSKIARYRVNGVMTIININANEEANVLRVPKNREMPTKNSMADSVMPPNRGKNEGNQEAMPNAVR